MPAGTSYTFKEGMLSPMIKKESADGRKYRYIEVKNQFLHATHPLGWIRRLELELDGERIDSEQVYFVIRGQWFLATTLHTIEEVFWHITEPARIYFPDEEEMPKTSHHVKCMFVLSMLEDPQILDRNDQWPDRTEFVEGELTTEEADR